MVMRCPKCGAEINSENATFCQQCGSSISASGGGKTLELFKAGPATSKFFFADMPKVEPDPTSGSASEPASAPEPEPGLELASEPVVEAAPAETASGTEPAPERDSEIPLEEAEAEQDLASEPAETPARNEEAAEAVEPDVEPAVEPDALPSEQQEQAPESSENTEGVDISPAPQETAEVASGGMAEPAATADDQAALSEDAAPADASDQVVDDAQPEAPQGVANGQPIVMPETNTGRRTGIIIGVIAAVVVALAVVAFLFLRPGGMGVDKSGFLGDWELVEGSYSGLEADTIDTLRGLGLHVVLTLNADDTGTFALFDEKSNVEWKATSATEGSLAYNGSNLGLKLSGDSLVAKDGGGDEMTFKRHDAIAQAASSSAATASASQSAAATSSSSSSSSKASSSASSAASSASSSSSNAEDAVSASSSASAAATENGMKSIGNAACGTMQIPSAWENRVSDYDKDLAESTDMVYFADPESEYSSETFGHFMFARAVQMRHYDASYDKIADQVVGGYDDEVYSNVDSREEAFKGRSCVIITTTVESDNLEVYNMVIDLGDKGTVLLTLQGTPNTVGDVLSYADSWEI